MMNWTVILIVTGVVASSYAFPAQEARYPRETAAVGAADNGAAASNNADNKVGAGAAAGIGGHGRSAEIGNFQANTRNNPFLPWGAFAGLNLGRGDRLGAGCSGLNCGFQLGDLALTTRQLFEGLANPSENRRIVRADNGNQYSNNDNYNNNAGYQSQYPYPPPNYYGGYNGFNNFNNYQQSFPSMNFDPYNMLQRPLDLLHQMQQQHQAQFQNSQQNPAQSPDSQNVADFARFEGGNGNNGVFTGGAFSSSFGSSSNGGKPVFQSTSINVDGDGKVTTIERGTDQEDRIITGRIGGNNMGANGVFASSGTKVDADGKVSSFRNMGSL